MMHIYSQTGRRRQTRPAAGLQLSLGQYGRSDALGRAPRGFERGACPYDRRRFLSAKRDPSRYGWDPGIRDRGMVEAAVASRSSRSRGVLTMTSEIAEDEWSDARTDLRR